jgi:hypothetical protein
MEPNFYFRCRTNPTAPLLVLHTEWESREMKTNPDYDRVDADGLPVVDEEELVAEEPTIPFHAGVRSK